ncbi:MAG: beta-ketoacyl-[acyl-carrier-protein] synthase family protein [Candidatus Omnitrophota bacterium]
MNKQIVITGIGVVSSIGIGKEAFWNALFAGKSGIKPVTLFDTSKTRSKLGGEIRDFEAASILGPKGLRNLDRTTLLALCAAKLCLEDAKLTITGEVAGELGVVLGSTMGSIKSISDFDLDSIREGPGFVNPAHFPNTVVNSPASQISIRFCAKKLNATVSNGYTAGLDAMGYAADLIRLGRAEMLLVGGVEELCLQTFLGLYKIGVLAGSRDSKPELSCPYDKRHNGIIAGEGSAIFLLETTEHAQRRNAVPYAEIDGYANAFDPARRNGYNPKGDGAMQAMELALSDSGLKAADIDAVSASANSTLECDVMETRALKGIFGKKAYALPVSALKSMTGELLSAQGAVSAASGIGCLQKNRLFQTVNYEEKDPRCDLDYVPHGREKRITHLMVNCFGPNGENASLVLSKP